MGGAANASKMAQSVGKLKMNTEEAYKILNINVKAYSTEAPLTKKIVDDIYLEHTNKNDPAKGGSFYLQSKIFRAKEAVDKDLERNSSNSGPSTATATATADTSANNQSDKK